MANLLDKAKEKLGQPPPAKKPPSEIQQKIERGRKQIRRGAPMRNLCQRFWRGEQNYFIDDKGVLNATATTTSVTTNAGKPRHRVRQYLNLIRPLVETKVSAATQRVPSYEVNPSSFDPQRVAAASLASKVSIYGYDAWKLRRATIKLVTLALVADEGFIWPFWDSSIGPFVQDGEGSYVGLGDIRGRVLSRNEVGWESGLDFEDSPWYLVEQGRPIDEVQAQSGYLGGELKPDANSAEGKPGLKKDQAEKLVLVTDFLERPCPKYPQGRWLTIANGRIIAGVSTGQDGNSTVRAYPLTDNKGRPVDEPILHRLSYTVDPDSDSDLGLVRSLIDPQRSFNDAWCRALEWKNRCLNPRILAPVGSLITNPDDTPGGIDYYRPVGGQVPQWENVPPIPESLFEIMRQASDAMQQIASAQDVPDTVDAGKAMQVFLEQQQLRWQSFLGDLADVHSRIMRHCLWLVQKHYTEPRLLQIRGRIGWEPIKDFLGAQLLGEDDVRVFAGSIEPLTRQAIQDRLNFLVSAFPGAITPEQAMAALEQGTAEDLIKDYELDIERANRIIQKIKAGPQALLGEPMSIDSQTGQETPAWMPRKFDNIPVQKKVFETFMKTDEYEALAPEQQHATDLYYEGLEYLQAQKDMQAAQAQAMMAEGQGMKNAAAPQGPTSQPSTDISGGISPPGGSLPSPS